MDKRCYPMFLVVHDRLADEPLHLQKTKQWRGFEGGVQYEDIVFSQRFYGVHDQLERLHFTLELLPDVQFNDFGILSFH
ncbi:hypothetical protein D3C81_1376130 [compost metagenome]